MCFLVRQSSSDFDDVEAQFELPYFVFDEIGELSFSPVYICCEKPTLVGYLSVQMVSYEDG